MPAIWGWVLFGVLFAAVVVLFIRLSMLNLRVDQDGEDIRNSRRKIDCELQRGSDLRSEAWNDINMTRLRLDALYEALDMECEYKVARYVASKKQSISDAQETT